ncbi:hypothetical protein DdX_15576 [Ditylenchus destructor]|uniref:Secreted protein n=1 Tax=Ditylenchus destructor TaxID=166010 RepID=A0AAD4MUS6_9BILA|nr:hypothetical protein DdX_15576 [Ditylenchus destructor]
MLSLALIFLFANLTMHVSKDFYRGTVTVQKCCASASVLSLQFFDPTQSNYKTGITRSHFVAKSGSHCGSQISNLEYRWTYWTDNSNQTGFCAAKQSRPIKDD